MQQRDTESESVLAQVVSDTGVTYSFMRATWRGGDGFDRHSLRIHVGRDEKHKRELNIPRWVIPALLDAIEKFRAGAQ